MTLYENHFFPSERALYGMRDVRLVQCAFQGAEDGESALKEAEGVVLEQCYMELRYPLWHCRGVTMRESVMTPTCRAALWYAEGVKAEGSQLHGIKAVRECRDVEIRNSSVVSAEFGWKCRGLSLEKTTVEGEYLFLDSQEIRFRECTLTGKYSFQYVQDVVIERSTLNTKDAFWHSRNVRVCDSVVRGEYLGWYSDGLTLERCHIVGTQPLCYATNLRLVECTMEGCDLSFEYSDVEATVRGPIDSVKNPRSGRILAEAYGEVLFTEDVKMPCTATVSVR